MSLFVKQIYTNCLAQASYYIESAGKAAVIDPLREPDAYLALARERNATIEYVLETHFHADFVSGHQELAKATGATIVYGPEAVSKYAIRNVTDGEEFQLGDITIRAIHTPGHTPESTCYLMVNKDGKYESIFTGDTLFVGDVGRPDLLEGVIVSKEEQLSRLYNSLEKLKALPDDVVVYPAHGPGSMCGKTIGTDKDTTIGKEKASNYALQPMDFETFSETILADQLPAPRYFVQNAIINRNGYEATDLVISRGLTALSPETVKANVASGAVIIDSRDADVFAKGYIKGAINVGLGGQFAIWVGTLFDTHQPVMVLSEPGKERETVLRLARVGFDNVLGTIYDWTSGYELDHVESISAASFVQTYPETGKQVLDVRRMNEYATNHLPTAQIIPLRDLKNRLSELDKDTAYQVHCAGGYRSMIAASVLKAEGFSHVTNIEGGIGAIEKAQAQLVA